MCRNLSLKHETNTALGIYSRLVNCCEVVDFSWLSDEDEDMLSREHKMLQQHHIHESWFNIICLTGTQPPILLKFSSFRLILRKIGLNSAFPTNPAFVHVVNLHVSNKLDR